MLTASSNLVPLFPLDGIVEGEVCTEEARSAGGSYPARQSMEASTAGLFVLFAGTSTASRQNRNIRQCDVICCQFESTFDARVGRHGKRTGRGRVPSAVPVPPVLGSHFLFFYLVNFLVVLFVRS